jgi:hypothetical protein
MTAESAASTLPDPSATDDDLAALPRPRRRFRTITLAVLAVTAVCSLWLALSLRGELFFTLRTGAPQDLGELSRLAPTLDQANTWVRAEAALSMAEVIRYSRPLESDTYRLARVEGNPRLWVELRVPEDADGARFVAPGSFVGRLVPANASGLRYGALSTAAAEAGHPLKSDAWLLIDGESPASTRWALGLELLLLGFAAFNLVGILRLSRPIRD